MSRIGNDPSYLCHTLFFAMKDNFFSNYSLKIVLLGYDKFLTCHNLFFAKNLS